MTLWAIWATFAGLDGWVTTRTGHQRTFSTHAAADAVAAALRQRSRMTTYEVRELAGESPEVVPPSGTRTVPKGRNP
jgi:hypothetical protein